MEIVMKKFVTNLFFLFILVNISMCSSPQTVESDLNNINPTLYNQIIGTWNFLSNNEFGKVEFQITFQNDGYVTGNYVSPSKEWRWKILNDNINYTTIRVEPTYNVYKNYHAPFTVTIFKNYNFLDYKYYITTLYYQYVDKLNFCILYTPHGENDSLIDFSQINNQEETKVVLFYTKNVSLIDEIKKINEQNEVNQVNITNKYIQSITQGFNNTDVINYNESYDDFILAHFNDRENKGSDVVYSGDEFQFEKDKLIYEQIKKKKYIVMYSNNKMIIPEYSFNTKSINFNENFLITELSWKNRSYQAELFQLNKPIIFKINPEDAELLYNDIRINNIDNRNENDYEVMTWSIFHNHDNRTNVEPANERFYFSKPYTMIVLFSIQNVEKNDIHKIHVVPLRSIIIFSDNKILKNY